MTLPEDPEHLPVAGDHGIEDDADHLGVAGQSRADLLVEGIGRVAPGIAGGRAVNARRLPDEESGFDLMEV